MFKKKNLEHLKRDSSFTYTYTYSCLKNIEEI